jgi:uncharacterized membrane protein YhaH (DUF805 family)
MKFKISQSWKFQGTIDRWNYAKISILIFLGIVLLIVSWVGLTPYVSDIVHKCLLVLLTVPAICGLIIAKLAIEVKRIRDIRGGDRLIWPWMLGSLVPILSSYFSFRMYFSPSFGEKDEILSGTVGRLHYLVSTLVWFCVIGAVSVITERQVQLSEAQQALVSLSSVAVIPLILIFFYVNTVRRIRDILGPDKPTWVWIAWMVVPYFGFYYTLRLYLTPGTKSPPETSVDVVALNGEAAQASLPLESALSQGSNPSRSESVSCPR